MLKQDQKYYWVTGQKSGLQRDIQALQKANAKRVKFCCAELNGPKPNLTKAEWNLCANSILVVPKVTAYDEGQRNDVKIVKEPFETNLLYISGPLLVVDSTYPDLNDAKDIITQRVLNTGSYNDLIEERVLPALLNINAMAKKEDKKAVIGMPGLGCGHFAPHNLQSEIPQHFYEAIEAIIDNHGQSLTHIGRIEFSTLSTESETSIANIQLHQGQNFPGLNIPPGKGEMSFRIVAWDPLSWPGNEYYTGSQRSSDDPVSILSTNVLQILTEQAGIYNNEVCRFQMADGSEYYDNADVLKKIGEISTGISNANVVIYDLENLQQVVKEQSKSVIEDKSDKKVPAESQVVLPKSWINTCGKSLVGVGVGGLMVMGIYAMITGGLPVELLAIATGVILIGLIMSYRSLQANQKNALVIN